MENNNVKRKVYWNNKELEKILTLKLVSSAKDALWQVEYCFGILKNDEAVIVELPFTELKKGNIKGQIVDFARDENVFAKGIDIFNSISTVI